MTDRHTYKLEGTREQLAADLRCSVADLSSALPNLKASGIGDVTLTGNGYVTLLSRRLERELLGRENSRKRVADHRLKRRCNTPCNANVTSGSGSGSGSSDPGLEGAGRKGFPVTPDDAIAQCGLQMHTRDWILHCYDKASSRGGRDAKDIEIRDFPAFVRTEWKYEQNRRGREQFGGDPNGNLTPMDKKIRSDEHVLVSKHLADLRASYDGHSTWKPADLDKRRRLEARQRELEKMLGMQLG